MAHALFGGYGGAAVAKAGFSAIIVSGWTKTLIFIVVAPLIGLTVGLVVMTSIYWIFRDATPARVDRWFRKLQLVSAAAYSLMLDEIANISFVLDDQHALLRHLPPRYRRSVSSTCTSG